MSPGLQQALNFRLLGKLLQARALAWALLPARMDEMSVLAGGALVTDVSRPAACSTMCPAIFLYTHKALQY